MKEPEEAKKLLEKSFEEAQHSYRGAIIERAFTLQVITLDFANWFADFEEDEEIQLEERPQILRGCT